MLEAVMVVDEVSDLLQHLIRNACVNDGTPESGHEVRTTALLSSYLAGAGLDIERYEALPGRGNLVARIEGSDPTAPSLLLMGHADVVPVNAARWRRDPFGGELVDGEVWGRGAVDMLNETSAMAVAFKALAARGWRPRGTLIYLAVADEEALGTYGADWILREHPDAVRADYVLTEFGGFEMPLASRSGPKRPIMVGEKGTHWLKLRIRGTAGPGSMPYRADNAVVKAAEVVRRVAEYEPAAHITDIWRRFVVDADLPEDIAGVLLDPQRLRAFVRDSDDLGVARTVQASTHTTFAPTIAQGGTKTNVIPDTVDLTFDIRTLPGQKAHDVDHMLRQALGDLADQVDVEGQSIDEATSSPIDTPLWDSMQRVTARLRPGSTNIPFTIVGATDARFFRRAGAVAYGAGLFGDRISFADFTSMFHGDNERIDQESLGLGVEFFEAVARDFLD
jgi:acetylornithine deacetylase/succinyl-diaminopimelate desuccinylase-like protein